MSAVGSCRLPGVLVERYGLSSLSLRGAKRRGNLAVPGSITGKPRRKRNCLPEIATAPSGRAMTRQGSAALGAVRSSELALLLPLRGRERHAAPLQRDMLSH